MKRFTNFEKYIETLTGGFDFFNKSHIINTITKNDVLYANNCVSTPVYKKNQRIPRNELKIFF